MRWVVVAVMALLVVAGCATADTEGAATSTGPSMPVMSAAELTARAADATAFADRMYGSWPDLDAFFADLAEDAVFYDASAGDYFVGRDVVVEFWATLGGQGMPHYFPDYRPTPRSVFLAADSVALPVDWHHLSDAEPWPDGVELFLFEGAEVAEYSLWYSDQTVEMLRPGFDWAGVEAWITAYVEAWTSEDGPGFLYAEDAHYADPVFGVTAAGNADRSWATLAELRFGGVDAGDVAVGDFYALPIGGSLLDDESGVDEGTVVGIAFIYRWPLLVDGTERPVESLVLAEFGSMGEDWHFDAHPELRIVRELVFHNADMLAAAIS